MQAIEQAVLRFSPAAVFVYVIRVPAMHGADVEAVSKAAEETWGVPVVTIDCAGYYGNKNFGQRIAGMCSYAA